MKPASRVPSEHLQARRALWNEKRKADGCPTHAGANLALNIGHPPRWAYCMRLYPNSLGWKRKAALAGALPVSLAVSDLRQLRRCVYGQSPIERQSTTCRPAAFSLAMALNGLRLSGSPIWCDGFHNVKWRKRLAALRGDTPVKQKPCSRRANRGEATETAVVSKFQL